MTERKETPIEKARREWKENLAKEQAKNNAVTKSPTPPTLETKEHPLSLSGALKLTQNINISYEPYAEDIKKTILVSNIPIHDETVEVQLRVIFNAIPGGINAIRFYPKGDTKTALIQFNEHTGFSCTHLPNYAKINENYIDIQPAKICIRQYQIAKYANMDDLLKRTHEELKLAQAADGSKDSQESEISKLRASLKERDAVIKTLQDIIHKMNAALTDAEEKLRKVSMGTVISPSNTSSNSTIISSITSTPSSSTIFSSTTIQEKQQKISEEEQANMLLIKKLIEEEKKKREKTTAATYLCSICFVDHPIDNIYILDGCLHRFCKECIAEWVKTKINDNDVKIVTCPYSRCAKEISYNEIRQIVADKVLFAKYEKFTLENALEGIAYLRWCPRAGCGNAMIGGADTLLMRCSNPSCLFCFCFNCKEEWHSDATCAQYQQWKKDNGGSGDNLVRQWIQQHTKRCPSCNVAIEKNGGCNHMTCKSCHHEFCWICMGQYTSGHFGDSGCPQYS